MEFCIFQYMQLAVAFNGYAVDLRRSCRQTEKEKKNIKNEIDD